MSIYAIVAIIRKRLKAQKRPNPVLQILNFTISYKIKLNQMLDGA